MTATNWVAFFSALALVIAFLAAITAPGPPGSA